MTSIKHKSTRLIGYEVERGYILDLDLESVVSKKGIGYKCKSLTQIRQRSMLK